MLGDTSADTLWWPRRGCSTHQDCYLYSPDGLIQRMKKFKTETILFGGSLDQLTRMEQDCPNPLSDLWRLINQQHSWFQNTPQFGPTLQSPTNLEGSRERTESWIYFVPWKKNSIYTVFPVCVSPKATLRYTSLGRYTALSEQSRDLIAKFTRPGILLSESSLHILVLA